MNAVLLTEWSEGTTDQVYGGRETFPIYTYDQFWAASSVRADTYGGGNASTKNGRMSYVGQFNYSYANKYLLSFSFREDGSMNFAPSQRWGFSRLVLQLGYFLKRISLIRSGFNS